MRKQAIIIAVMLLAGCVKPETGQSENAPGRPKNAEGQAAGPMKTIACERRSLGDFEDNTTQGWFGDGNKALAKISLSQEHAAQGKRSLRAEFPPDDYPGIVIKLGSQDWSAYDAFRFSVFNTGKEDIRLDVRIDDTHSQGYNSRYNQEGEITLSPGANQVEIPVRGLQLPTIGSRGLDVRRIREVHLFSLAMKGKAQPRVLYFDDIHLARYPRSGDACLLLTDLDGHSRCTWRSSYASTVRCVKSPVAKQGKALRITLSDTKYPGIEFADVPENWLPYDLFCFDITCPEGAASPSALYLKFTDRTGRSATSRFRLKQGTNSYCFPLLIAGHTSLGQMGRIVFFDRGAGKEFYIDNLCLRRLKPTSYPPIRALAEGEERLRLDFTRAKSARNTCYAAMIDVPLRSGENRIVHCSSVGRKVLEYSLGSDVFAGEAAGSPVHIWAFVKDHGVWHWTEQKEMVRQKKSVQIAFK